MDSKEKLTFNSKKKITFDREPIFYFIVGMLSTLLMTVLAQGGLC